MKRTTLILLIVVALGALSVIASSFFLKSYGRDKRADRPSMQLTDISVKTPRYVVVRQTGNVNYDMIDNIGDFEVKTDSGKTATFAYPSEMKKFISVKSLGDTLIINFNVPASGSADLDLLDKLTKNAKGNMVLTVNTGLASVKVGSRFWDLCCTSFHSDSIQMVVASSVKLDSCTFGTLSMDVEDNVKMSMSKIQKYYINLDNNPYFDCSDTQIDNLYFTASHYVTVQGQITAKQLFWQPKNAKSTLEITLTDKAMVKY